MGDRGRRGGARTRVWPAIMMAAAVAAGPAQARPLPGQSVTFTGSLTIAWSGDPARGCAAAGQCGVSGALQALPSGSMASFPGPTPLELSDSSAVARVITRTPGGAVAATCADPVPVDLVFAVRRTAGGLRAVLSAQNTFQPPSSGQCAGPTAGDLRALALPARRLGGRGYSLAGTATFGAGPFTVTATSTLRVLVGRAGGTSGGPVPPPPVGPGSPPGAPRPHRAFQEQVNAVYRITSTRGALDTAFAGRPVPLCAPTGACGAHGDLRQSLGAGTTVSFSAFRVVRRRLSRAAVLRDLRRGRLRPSAFGQLTGSVAETVAAGDGTTCSDTGGPVTLQLSSRASRRGGDMLLLQAGGYLGGIDPLRTRCAGPSAEQVAGGRALAAAPLTPAALGARTLSLTLGVDRGFSGMTYAGRRSGAVTLTLALVHLSARTQRTTVFSPPPSRRAAAA